MSTSTKLITLKDGRVFPEYEGQAISWSIGLYHTWEEEKKDFPRMRAVIRAMKEHRPEQLQREYHEALKASFDRIFGRNAAKEARVIEEEMAK